MAVQLPLYLMDLSADDTNHEVFPDIPGTRSSRVPSFVQKSHLDCHLLQYPD